MHGLTNVRTERRTDISSIRKVHDDSFPTRAESQLVDALRDADRLIISLVCEVDETVVAHVVFSPVVSGDSDGGLGLGPVAVLPAYRRRGIAESLVNVGLDACREMGCGFVVVLGDPKYYRRLGFRPASNWGLVDEYGGGTAFQAIELRTGAMTPAKGVVKYAPEFGTVGGEEAAEQS